MKGISIKNWSLIRKLQLGMGLFCLGDFIFSSQGGAVLAMGLILILQAIADLQLGCATGV